MLPLSPRRHLTRLWPYILAFAVLLLLADPVARGVAVCLTHGVAGCPGEAVGGQ